MSDPRAPDDRRPTGEASPELARLLADPAMWAPPDEATEDAIVAAIRAERHESAPVADADDGPTNVVWPWDEARRWFAPVVVGVAAALAVLGGFAALDGGDEADDEGRLLALAAPAGGDDATAEANVVDTPQGTKIVLDVTGLPPAPDGAYYELTLGEEDGGGEVSAGTFHLRGGDGSIALWAGVTLETHPELTVTLEQEDGAPGPDGEVVLEAATPTPTPTPTD